MHGKLWAHFGRSAAQDSLPSCVITSFDCMPYTFRLDWQLSGECGHRRGHFVDSSRDSPPASRTGTTLSSVHNFRTHYVGLNQINTTVFDYHYAQYLNFSTYDRIAVYFE
jgi:hypothetical protein